MIDLHSHLLPGIDDGPERERDAVAMARLAVADGVATMCATPHMMSRFPTLPARMRDAVDALRARLAQEAVPLEVLSGGEIALPYLPRLGPDDLAAATLGGGGRWLLIEMPFRGPPMGLAEALTRLEFQGLGAVLAHPERSEWVQRSPDRLHELVGRGALVQLTASSFLGESGPRARDVARALLRGGLAHLLASDAHSPDRRPPGLGAGLQAAAAAVRVEPEALEWMVREGPALVIAGQAVRPPRLVRPRARAPAQGPPADTRAAPRGRPRPTRR